MDTNLADEPNLLIIYFFFFHLFYNIMCSFGFLILQFGLKSQIFHFSFQITKKE